MYSKHRLFARASVSTSNNFKYGSQRACKCVYGLASHDCFIHVRTHSYLAMSVSVFLLVAVDLYSQHGLCEELVFQREVMKNL